MADARLVWRELSQAQPNVAPLIGQANDAFNNAADAASGILGRYQAGIEGKNDAEVRQELAAIKDEAGLDKWLANGGLNGRQVSDDVLGLVTGGRNTIIGYTNDRSIVRDRDGRLQFASDANSRLNAAEGRTASEWNDQQARQQWLRANAGLGTQAEEIARAAGSGPGEVRTGQFSRIGSHVFGNADAGQGPINGNTGALNVSEDTRLRLARTLQAEAGNQGVDGMIAVGSVIRNRAASGKYGTGIDGVIMKPGQFSAWNSETGYAGGEQGQNMNFQPNAQALAAADAILSGNYQDQTGGATHYYNPDISNPAWGARGADIAPAATSRVAYQQAMIDSGLFSPADIRAASDPIRSAEAAGQAERDRADAKIVEEQIAAANQALLDNPEINTPEQLRRAVMEDQNFTATENEQRYQNLRSIIADDPTRLRPATAEDPTTVAATVGAVEAASRALDANPQTSLFAQADRLAPDANQSAGQKLAAAVGLDAGNRENPTSWFGNTEEGFNQADLDRMVARVATRNQVSEEVAAAAMARAYEDDPWGKNTLANRFDADKVDAIIKSIGQNDERDYKEARRNVGVLQNRLETLRTNEQLLRAQLSQYPEGSAQRAAIQAQIDAGRQQMSAAEQELSKAQPRNSN
ncbi:structural protein [Ruegeria phage vB_RpoP-V13]|uniref:Structural protein n=1 Tax=Ruegeria phage vB_RpoP-V13 TaxID=2218612 RepID=A0A2Z4QGJ6_9CAUD|nr:structural protein [Ruegeria phage vB_RpoP-V13]AWY09412.1 structural protein [Ruegeria phage vB_RpoP-V13]